jgi:hypothetical protein
VLERWYPFAVSTRDDESLRFYTLGSAVRAEAVAVRNAACPGGEGSDLKVASEFAERLFLALQDPVEFLDKLH